MIKHEHDRYSLYTGNSLEEMKNLKDNSVDSIVTDPPYGISFMGKNWDHGVPGIPFWKEAIRVAKPGAFLLAFGGTRTFHRLMVAVEDAGWEVRDTIMWVYGCLDTKTECLTRSGWKCYTDLSTDDEVMQWDASTESLSWTHPEEVMIYPYKGEMVNLSNRHTDQMLTPNHRVYSKVRNHSRNPKPVGYDVVEAGNLKNNWQVTLPMAGELQGSMDIDPDYAYIVGWWLTDAWAHGDGKAVMFSQSKPETLLKLRESLSPYNPSEYVKKAKKDTHNEEHTFYVTGDIASKLIAEFPGRRLLWDVLDWSYDARKRLFDGLMDGDGSLGGKDRHAVAFWSKNQDRRDVFGVLALSLGYRTYEDQKKGCVHVNLTTSTTQIQSKHRVDPVKYEGDVWCVRVPNGAFVVRRSGKPFITGNSGFPKSLDVSKAIDKKFGAEREVGPPNKWVNVMGSRPKMDTTTIYGSNQIDKRTDDPPATPEAEQWDGWGTALKPAWEPIIVARKPVEGTVANNVLKYGTGGINIDGCRVEIDSTEKGMREHNSKVYDGVADGYQRPNKSSYTHKIDWSMNTQGRFPANLIHDGSEQVVGLFPVTKSGEIKGNKVNADNSIYNTAGSTLNRTLGFRESSKGSAARFFYCAKASKRDRNEGCDELEPKIKAMGNQAVAEIKRGNDPTETLEKKSGMSLTKMYNNHSTVKPIDLMRYLCKLVTSPKGIVLDPFMGSGSTGKAAMYEDFNFIGIDLDEEYTEIAKARIDFAIKEKEKDKAWWEK